MPLASRWSDFLSSRSKFLAESLPLGFFSFASNFFVRLHLLIFWFCIDFSWDSFLLLWAQIRFAAENFFHCHWSQCLERSSAACFSSSSPTNFLSLPCALSAADLAARFARRPLFFGFLGLGQFSCADDWPRLHFVVVIVVTCSQWHSGSNLSFTSKDSIFLVICW
jgi:hypothetical protein